MKSSTTSHAIKSNLFQFFIGILFLTGIHATSQNIYSVLNESWISNDWRNETQTFNTYDNSNYLTNSLTQLWVTPPGIWENSAQIIYSNNADGTVNQAVTQYWDFGTSSWNDGQRSLYTYNAAKDILTTTSQLWMDEWLNFSKTTNTYDGSGYLTHTLNQSWDFIASNWKNNSQTNFTNNPNGTVNQSITQDWDATNVWVNRQRVSYTYTGDNKVLVATEETWTGSSWLNYSKETNTYDPSGYLTNSLLQLWDSSPGIWVNDTQSIITNTAGGTPVQIVGQTWNAVISGWSNSFRTTFNYTLGIAEFTEKNGFALYPNPTTDVINVKLSENFNSAYLITDQTGRIIQKGLLYSEITELDVSSLAKGVYFFTLDQNSKNYLKLVKN